VVGPPKISVLSWLPVTLRDQNHPIGSPRYRRKAAFLYAFVLHCTRPLLMLWTAPPPGT
jgi:hypothetical protein